MIQMISCANLNAILFFRTYERNGELYEFLLPNNNSTDASWRQASLSLQRAAALFITWWNTPIGRWPRWKEWWVVWVIDASFHPYFILDKTLCISIELCQARYWNTNLQKLDWLDRYSYHFNVFLQILHRRWNTSYVDESM